MTHKLKKEKKKSLGSFWSYRSIVFSGPFCACKAPGPGFFLFFLLFVCLFFFFLLINMLLLFL